MQMARVTMTRSVEQPDGSVVEHGPAFAFWSPTASARDAASALLVGQPIRLGGRDGTVTRNYHGLLRTTVDDVVTDELASLEVP